ncbi:hypothetical protein UlMin_005521 [Ulmus minor]
MGNCLVLQEKVIKVMKPDGKVLEYREPMRAYQVSSQFSGHAISETAPVSHHLRPEAKLLGGRLYYLVPLPLRPRNKEVVKKKKVRFSDQEVVEKDRDQQKEEEESCSKVVRIKLVISKQELQEMLKNGVVSLGGVANSQVRTDQKTKDGSSHRFDDHDQEGFWKPVLESIPEFN